MAMETQAPISNQQPLGNGGARSSAESVERVLEAGQRLLTDRFNLLKIELRETVKASAKGSISIASGLMLAGIGGGILLAALVAVLMLVLPLWASLAVAGGACILIGASLGLWGRTILKRRTQLRAAAQEVKGIFHPLESSASRPAISAGDGRKRQPPARREEATQPQTLNG